MSVGQPNVLPMRSPTWLAGNAAVVRRVRRLGAMTEDSVGALHHVEIWVPHLERARAEWGWLLSELGYGVFQQWEHGCSWKLGAMYIVVEHSPALTVSTHRRTVAGVNHLAFHAGNQANVDRLVVASAKSGWSAMLEDQYPYAGGPGHYAAYLENTDGYEVELVAGQVSAQLT